MNLMFIQLYLVFNVTNKKIENKYIKNLVVRLNVFTNPFLPILTRPGWRSIFNYVSLRRFHYAMFQIVVILRHVQKRHFRELRCTYAFVMFTKCKLVRLIFSFSIPVRN